MKSKDDNEWWLGKGVKGGWRDWENPWRASVSTAGKPLRFELTASRNSSWTLPLQLSTWLEGFMLGLVIREK